MTALEIVGREGVLASVRAFVERIDEGFTALVLEGEAGIGKSTLWLAAVEHARSRGLRVLRSRPAEAERGLVHVGLGDLFEDVLDEVLPALPAPRRRALEIALAREDQAGAGLDPRTLGLATRGALESLSRDSRLFVAIDDVQWLDDASARALAFALRRLSDANLGLLLARRIGMGLPSGAIEQAIGAERRWSAHHRLMARHNSYRAAPLLLMLASPASERQGRRSAASEVFACLNFIGRALGDHTFQQRLILGLGLRIDRRTEIWPGDVGK